MAAAAVAETVLPVGHLFLAAQEAQRVLQGLYRAAVEAEMRLAQEAKCVFGLYV
jgi:hypothetical protein